MRLKKPAKKKKVPVNLKMEHEEKEAIQVQADLYAGGNLSAWLRYAGLNHKPRKGDLIAEDDGPGF